jgi:molybdenum cofactor guanylyltransferase
MNSSLSIAILAGGASRRMGQDKVALFLPGLLDTLAPLGLPIFVVGRAGDDPRATFLPDDFPGEGPLGGLVTALSRAGGPVLLLACDLPRLTSDAVRWLIDTQVDEGDGLVVRQSNGELEPLFSIYAPGCLSQARERLASGRRSLRGLIERGNFAEIILPEKLTGVLHNVNTPDDLRTSQAVADATAGFEQGTRARGELGA